MAKGGGNSPQYPNPAPTPKATPTPRKMTEDYTPADWDKQIAADKAKMTSIGRLSQSSSPKSIKPY